MMTTLLKRSVCALCAALVLAQPALAAPEAAAAAAAADAPATAITVTRGTWLGKIAQELAAEAGVPPEVMVVALVKRNPRAFADGHLDRLRTDLPLQRPDPDMLKAMSLTAARLQLIRWQKDGRLAGPAAAAAASAAVAASLPAADDVAVIATDPQAKFDQIQARVAQLEAQQPLLLGALGVAALLVIVLLVLLLRRRPQAATAAGAAEAPLTAADLQPVAASAPPASAKPQGFDFSNISLDLDEPPSGPHA